MEQTPGQVAAADSGGVVDATTREWLIKQLRRVLEIGLGRVTHPKTPPNDRIKWSRVVIAAGQATNSILRDVDIEALQRQITELKQLTQERLSDEQADDQEEPGGSPEED